MDAIAEIGQPTYLPFQVIAGRLGLATLLGAIVGFEREWREQPAGLRTHILVCLAAAVVSLLAVEMTHSDVFQGDTIRLDPIRLIEAVTAGVAFLAAGTIIFARGEVHGLTTGAGMWLAGAIGLACGMGYWQIGVLATALGLVVLVVLRKFERKFEFKDGSEGFASLADGEGAGHAATETPAKRAVKPKP